MLMYLYLIAMTLLAVPTLLDPPTRYSAQAALDGWTSDAAKTGSSLYHELWSSLITGLFFHNTGPLSFTDCPLASCPMVPVLVLSENITLGTHCGSSPTQGPIYIFPPPPSHLASAFVVPLLDTSPHPFPSQRANNGANTKPSQTPNSNATLSDLAARPSAPISPIIPSIPHGTTSTTYSARYILLILSVASPALLALFLAVACILRSRVVSAWKSSRLPPLLFVVQAGDFLVLVDTRDEKTELERMVELPPPLQTPSRQGVMQGAVAPETPPSPSLRRPLLPLTSERNRDVFLATFASPHKLISPLARLVTTAQAMGAVGELD